MLEDVKIGDVCIFADLSRAMVEDIQEQTSKDVGLIFDREVSLYITEWEPSDGWYYLTNGEVGTCDANNIIKVVSC